MKITLLVVGKTDSSHIKELFEMYQKRLNHYIKFHFIAIADIKNTKKMSSEQQKIKEGQSILKQLSPTDQLILLDEKGKMFSSVEFSNFLQKKMNSGIKNIVFAIGGPYGFSEEIYQKSVGKISLSKMTFSHQMIRIFMVEQLYRAFTILKNEPYHNE